MPVTSSTAGRLPLVTASLGNAVGVKRAVHAANTTQENPVGPTLCRAIHWWNYCWQPFEHPGGQAKRRLELAAATQMQEGPLVGEAPPIGDKPQRLADEPTIPVTDGAAQGAAPRG